MNSVYSLAAAILRMAARACCAPELDEDAALRVVEPVAGDPHLACLVGGTAVMSVSHAHEASHDSTLGPNRGCGDGPGRLVREP